MSDLKHYLFEGWIEVNGHRYESNVSLETFAPTEKKAANNIRYRYAKDNGIHISRDVNLHGTFKVVG